MPKGVEHADRGTYRHLLEVRSSVMPKGVEHIAIQTGFDDDAG